MNRKWISEVLRDETKSAFILFSIAAITLALALSPYAQSLINFANTEFAIGQFETNLRSFSSQYLLAIFFLIAGIELRHEISQGSLNTFRSGVVPVFAAIGGMATPALIYISVSSLNDGWGIPIATDLPFALGIIAIFGRRLSLEVRAFLLALAIVDDALSVLIIAFGLGHTSIHPTLIAVLIGLVIPPRNQIADRVRHFLQPISSGIALPLFAITALAIPIKLADFLNEQSFAISIARLAGKPIGITFGAMLAIYLFRARPSISVREILAVGATASIGFSVSLLFVNLSSFSQALIVDATAGVVVAIPLCAVLGGIVSFVTKDPSRNKI